MQKEKKLQFLTHNYVYMTYNSCLYVGVLQKALVIPSN